MSVNFFFKIQYEILLESKNAPQLAKNASKASIDFVKIGPEKEAGLKFVKLTC